MTLLEELESSIRAAVEQTGPAVVGLGRGWGVGSGVVIAPGRVLTSPGVAAHPFATAVPERNTLGTGCVPRPVRTVSCRVSKSYLEGSAETAREGPDGRPGGSVKMLTEPTDEAAKTVTDEPGL